MMNKLVKFTRYMLLIGLLLVPNSVFAMHKGGGGQDDPWSRMDYDYAFDPKRFKEFKELMENWGCADNVFKRIHDEAVAPIEYDEAEKDDDAQSPGWAKSLFSSPSSCVCCCLSRRGTYDHLAGEPAEPDYVKQEKDFRVMCLTRLKRARWWATMKPAAGDTATCCCIGVGTCCITKRQGNQALGGSLAEGGCIFNTAFLAKSIMESLATCWWPPVNSLATLEEQFALEQCFIPQEIWPRIIEQFKQARANPLSQQEAIRSIEQLLITRFKPKKAVSMHEDRAVDKSAADILDRSREGILLRRVDSMLKEFCAQYEPMEDMEYSQLSNGIFNFVNKVMYDRGEVKPLFLVGPWGVGKTHFFAVLQKWFNELLPEAIYVNQPEIGSSEQLAGSHKEPGLFLDTLRNQVCTRSKRGSLIFLDEAMWLNSQVVESAKRTFSDEKFSDLVADFLKTANNVSLKMTPVLFLVASNDEITDENLKSRFGITIHFPHPKKEALVSYAKDFLEKEPIGDIVRTADSKKRAAIYKTIEDYIMHGPEEEQNFRAAKRVEILVTGILLGRIPLTVLTPSRDEVRRLGAVAAQRRMAVLVPVSMMDDGVGTGAKLEVAKKIE